MGTKIIDIPVGVDCPDCWGISSPYPYFQTPEYVFATFSGISKGSSWSGFYGEPPNGTYKLTQEVQPCYFSIGYTPVWVVCHFGSVYSWVSLHHPVLLLLFQCTTTGCLVGGTNSYDDPAGQVFYGGNVIISWRTSGRSWRT